MGPCSYLFVPGYGNSLGDHWQAQWFLSLPRSHWAQLGQWESPDKNTWVAHLDAAIAACETPVVLISHSLGGLAIAHWAQTHPSNAVLGAWLVAVPDPARPHFPSSITGFEKTPRQALPFPSMMLISEDDPYAELPWSLALAADWGAQYQRLGDAGHINLASGFGPWPSGKAALLEWQAGIAR
jgi:uncharacterized protein